MKTTRLISLLAILSLLAVVPGRSADNPSTIKTTVPKVSDELAMAPGEVELQITLNNSGLVTQAAVKRSTNPQLEQPCLDAVRQWRYTAPTGGMTTFVQPFRFGGDTFDTTPLSSTRPEPRTKVAPKLSDELTDVSGEVMVALEIDAKGTPTNVSVVKSSHEELNPACLAAAKQWSFKPATNQGKGIASKVYVPFVFTGTPGVTVAASAKAELVDNDKLIPIRQETPFIPVNLATTNAEAVYAITVDPHGYVVAAKVQSTTNIPLAELGQEAILHWKFQPIVKSGVPIYANAIQPMRFGEGSVSVTPVDRVPTRRDTVMPVIPDELVGINGLAQVLFEIDAVGHVTNVTVTDATDEGFKTAILKVAKDWQFRPAMRNGVAVPAKVTVPIQFVATN